ncbi:phage minor capsid protein [Streptococcus sp. 263_SSPC]|uniref:phage minor capsid protein n=1 Tax=Streptococcus sp. 263_SSPC TaxID=1579343 RepID=UPI00069CD274|nr:phage minor capsid protein [Streptococcus sp. 263_SSPC]
MVYDVSRAFERIENELLESMTRNLKKHKAEETELGIEWTQWQAIQLEELHRFKQEAAKKYGLEFKSMNKKIRETIAEASLQGASDEELNILKTLEKGYVLKRERGLSAGFFQTNQKRLDALMNAVEHDMKTAQTAVLRYANDQYRKIIFQSQVAASSGALTYEKAVDMATSDFLKKGINCITYSNGAVHNIVSYADMAVRTASKRAYLMGEGQKRQEWGVSTVILNKRFNACPLCMPFEGKVLIDDVWSGGSSKDGPYPLMSSAMAAGLYHPNCKDKHSTYFEGISSKPESRYYEEKPVIKERQLIENKLNHAKRQAKSYNRLAKNSLDVENQETYRARATEWRDKAKGYREELKSFEESHGLELENVEKYAKEEYNYLEEDYSEALKKFGKINKSQVEKIYANSTRDTGYIATGNSFDINRAFRNKEPNLLREVDLITSKTLDEVIKSNKTPYNIKGFRKVNLDWVSNFIKNADIPKTYDSIQDVSDALNSIIGHKYEELGYSSISVNPNMNVFSNRRVQLDIEIPKGSNAYLTLNVQESELIMGRGTIFELKESSVIEDDYEEILKIILRVIK